MRVTGTCEHYVSGLTQDMRQSKTLILSTNVDENRVFDCHLLTDWRQVAIENNISSNFDRRLLRAFLIAAYTV